MVKPLNPGNEPIVVRNGNWLSVSAYGEHKLFTIKNILCVEVDSGPEPQIMITYTDGSVVRLGGTKYIDKAVKLHRLIEAEIIK